MGRSISSVQYEMDHEPVREEGGSRTGDRAGTTADAREAPSPGLGENVNKAKDVQNEMPSAITEGRAVVCSCTRSEIIGKIIKIKDKRILK
uniref:Uncharacterized protein n=1 Tax=Pristionchus pacificus TaxID=54126 RepID=A0A2A6CK31_PRIPA|eukprot:PDM78437.1 hypothetical protein PRIPAC_31016 [Pristionchus pacificus]